MRKKRALTIPKIMKMTLPELERISPFSAERITEKRQRETRYRVGRLVKLRSAFAVIMLGQAVRRPRFSEIAWAGGSIYTFNYRREWNKIEPPGKPRAFSSYFKSPSAKVDRF